MGGRYILCIQCYRVANSIFVEQLPINIDCKRNLQHQMQMSNASDNVLFIGLWINLEININLYSLYGDEHCAALKISVINVMKISISHLVRKIKKEIL